MRGKDGWGAGGGETVGVGGQGAGARAQGPRARCGAWASWNWVPGLQGVPQGPEKGWGRLGWGRLGAPGASHGANSAPSIRRDESNKLL